MKYNMTLTVEIKPSNPNDLPALLREVADDIETYKAVSYTHLTLPRNREV